MLSILKISVLQLLVSSNTSPERMRREWATSSKGELALDLMVEILVLPKYVG